MQSREQVNAAHGKRVPEVTHIVRVMRVESVRVETSHKRRLVLLYCTNHYPIMTSHISSLHYFTAGRSNLPAREANDVSSSCSRPQYLAACL